MANYAIIIGIDGYSDPRWTLAGAVTDALDFTRWAIGAGGVPADDAHLRLLLSPAPGGPAPALPPGVTSAAATGAGIRLAELRRALPEGGGDRLYFYYAGHGASVPQWRSEPILIPVDFSDPEVHAHLPLGVTAFELRPSDYSLRAQADLWTAADRAPGAGIGVRWGLW